MRRPRILVVDDEPDILLALRTLIEGALGGEVVVTTMPHVALMALGSKPGFDLVMADYRMPGMDGLTFLQRAKEQHPGTPRIFMTAFMDPRLKRDAVELGGARLCLSKPFDPDEFLDVVGKILGQPPRGDQLGRGKPPARRLGRVPAFGSAPRAGPDAEEELETAACSVCGAQVIVDGSEFTQDGSGWVARPCFLTPGCRGKIQP